MCNRTSVAKALSITTSLEVRSQWWDARRNSSPACLFQCHFNIPRHTHILAYAQKHTHTHAHTHTLKHCDKLHRHTHMHTRMHMRMHTHTVTLKYMQWQKTWDTGAGWTRWSWSSHSTLHTTHGSAPDIRVFVTHITHTYPHDRVQNAILHVTGIPASCKSVKSTFKMVPVPIKSKNVDVERRGGEREKDSTMWISSTHQWVLVRCEK